MKEVSGDSKIVMGYIYSALFWGVIGLVLGLLISVQMWSVSFILESIFHSAVLERFTQMFLLMG